LSELARQLYEANNKVVQLERLLEQEKQRADGLDKQLEDERGRVAERHQLVG
jgi:cell division protein FtsL